MFSRSLSTNLMFSNNNYFGKRWERWRRAYALQDMLWIMSNWTMIQLGHKNHNIKNHVVSEYPNVLARVICDGLSLVIAAGAPELGGP
ncbi:hypothetical protein LSTR_LSTR008845 [Laodelphax striatellus]|uniref:Uncharacterized protein n=1 Tax=Laodelphax striatellus TaxID=195883 RepID=A0A482WU06_LAOST|nr:hypothetical protein LSTR_LSTR008845 [Laodelphax striatellus]